MASSPAASPQSAPPAASAFHLPGTAVPSVTRRFAGMLYEGILLFGVVFIPAYLFSALLQFKGGADSPLRHVFQLYMFCAIGLYFTLCWTRSGQTLPMKTWKFRLVAAGGARVSAARAWARYALAWLGPVLGIVMYKSVVEFANFGTAQFSVAAFWIALPFLLVNWLWAYVDRERQFLHDRLARTRLVSVA